MNLNNSVSNVLIDRLICAKYLFRNGTEILESGSHFASGLAVLNYQDAAELTLRVIAEHHHVSLKENEAFNRIIDLIDEKANEDGLNKLTHRSSLNQLNKTRVNFKHYAIRPNLNDVHKFKNDLEIFFNVNLRLFLELDFQDLSLVNLISHNRTKNWLKKAEKFLLREMYLESVTCSRVAFEVFRKHIPRAKVWDVHEFKTITGELKGREPISNSTIKIVRKVDERFEEIGEHLNILFDGISPELYSKFISTTPAIDFNYSNEVARPKFAEDGKIENDWYANNLPEIDNNKANFCLNFLLETLLRLQENLIPPKHKRPSPNRIYELNSDTSVYVSEAKNEEIKKLKKGDKVKSYNSLQAVKGDLFPIVDEYMTVYIEKKAVNNG